MTITEHRTTALQGSSFDSLDPATGDVVATYPVHTADEVRQAVARPKYL